MNRSIRSTRICTIPWARLSFALALFLLLSPGLRAQNAPPPPQNAPAPGDQGPPMPHHHGHAMNPKRQLDYMTRKLNLTTVEQQKILPILREQHRELKSLRKDSAATRQDIRQQWQSIHQTTQQKIKAVLSGPQRQQYGEMIANMHKHMRQYWKQMKQDAASSAGASQSNPPANGNSPSPAQ